MGIKIPKPLKVYEPYGWQLKVMDIVKEEPDERTIYWFWERNGNCGKTHLCKYLAHTRNALLLGGGKASDMFHAINKYDDKRELILINIPRDKLDYINYGAIEQIKDGAIFSGKYDSCSLIFNCPHLFIFANEEPDRTRLSRDRWRVYNIERLMN